MHDRLKNLVFFLYGDKRVESIDELRYKIFSQKFEKEGKVVDLSLLPPCKANFQLHTIRANYVAQMYRQAKELVMNLDNPDNHEWDDQGNVIWSNICYPEDLSELLVDMEDKDVAETEFDDDFLGDDDFVGDDFEEDI